MGKEKKTAQIGVIATDRQAVTLDESGRVLSPPPPARKRVKHIKLETVRDVRDELARLYRQARGGEVPPEVASRFTFMLGTLGKLIVDSELETRLSTLEEQSQQLGD